MPSCRSLMFQMWRGTLARWKYKRTKAALTILRYYRRYKVKSYILEVVRRFNGVRNSRDYGKNVKWPTPPKVLRKFQDFMQSIFNRYLRSGIELGIYHDVFPKTNRACNPFLQMESIPDNKEHTSC